MAIKSLCSKNISPQDKGYAWLILVMSVLSHFAHAGFSFGVVGNLTIIHQEVFGINLQQSGIIGTVHVSMVYLCGPIVSVLINKYGSRATELLGAVCITLGVGLSALSSQFWHAVLLFSLLAGFGVSCCYSASSQVLALSFERFKYIAFASATIGYSVGIVVWPVLSEYLLSKHGYSKAMGIMASIQVIHIIAGLIFPAEVDEPENKEMEIKELPIAGNANTHAVDSGQKLFILGKMIVKVILDLKAPVVDVDSQKELPEKPEDLEQQQGALNMGGADNLAYEAPSDIPTQSREASSNENLDSKIKSTLKDDFMMLFKSWKIWLLIGSSMFWSANVSGFLILINDYIVRNTSMDSTEAALGITIMGVAHIGGNLVVLSTGTLKYDRLILHTLSISVYSVLTILSAFTNSKEMYYGVTACFGLVLGAQLANVLAVIHDLSGVKYIHLGFGIELFSEGIGNLGFVSLAAYLSQEKGERYGLIVSGCFGILCSLLILPAVVYRIAKNRKCLPSRG